MTARPATAVMAARAAAAARAARLRAAGRAPRITVTSLADSGRGTLRAAIRLADSRPPGRLTRIGFSVAGVITLASPLPALTRPVVIDAATAPGHRRGGPPAIELDCHGHAGLRFGIGSRGSALLGVSVTGASGNGVTLAAGRITLNGDYIGLTPAGTPAGNRGDGVYAAPTSARDRIGVNTSGDSGAVANVISANGGSGIVLDGSSRDLVQDNRIGTSPQGRTALPNRGNGIWITSGAHGDRIGGPDFTDAATGEANNPTGSKGTVPPVFVVPPQGNLVSGNAGAGILIDDHARGNVLNGNFVGTTADGDARLGNGSDGVRIDHADGNSLTGCRFVNNPFAYYNVVSGNGGNGLRITDSDGTVVQGNFFGVAADNAAALGNRGDGILVQGTSSDTLVGGVIPLGNVASGNGRNGIEVTGRARGFTTFNTFGGLLAFKGAAPNGGDGLLVTATGGNILARTNVFSGNRRNGIEIGGNASGVTVDPDIVGLTTKGDAPLPNGGDGLLIDGTAHGNVIGGTLRSVIPQNTFSGNAGYGIAITGRAHGNRVFLSDVGTEVLGRTAIGNGRGGVLVAGLARGNVIGALARPPANLISGNTGNGVTLGPGTRGNFVLGNFIGLNRFARPLPNTGRPVVNRGHGNVIRRNRTG